MDEKSKTNLVTTKELSKLVGLSEATIDHYTDMGLLKVSARREGRRLFERTSSVEIIKKIQESLSRGMSLAGIKRAFISNNNGQQILCTLDNNRRLAIIRKFSKKRILVSPLIFSCVCAFFFVLGFMINRRG